MRASTLVPFSFYRKKTEHNARSKSVFLLTTMCSIATIVLFRVIDKRTNTGCSEGEEKSMTRKQRNVISLDVLLDLFALIYKRYTYDA